MKQTAWVRKLPKIRCYDLVYAGDKGWQISVEDQSVPYWLVDNLVNSSLDLLGHPCCAPPYGSRFWFWLPDFVHGWLFHYYNLPCKLWDKDQQAARIPLTSELAYQLDPEFYDRIQKELAEQELEDALDLSSDED